MNNTVADRLQPKLSYALIFGSILVLGLPLNAVSLWILLRRHSLGSPSTVFMVNLAISDLLLVISLPTRVYFYATGSWPLGSMVCIWITMLFRNNIRSSSIFITFICVDRLLAVVYPLRSRHVRTSSNAWRAAALVWLFVLVVNVPESVYFSRYLKRFNNSACFEFPRCQDCRHLATVYLQSVLVWTMLVVNVVCTIQVSWALRRHLNVSAGVNNKVNVMLIFFMNLIMFAVCFVPITIGLLTEERSALRPLVCLTTVNCCLDPLLYYFSLDAFWKKKDDVASAGEQQTLDSRSWRQVFHI